MKKYILNSPILTNFGTFAYERITLEIAKAWADFGNVISAIGHAATAEILSILLEKKIPVNRIEIKMETSDEALVFQLKKRLNEGQVLKTIDEIENIGYTFGLITKI